MRFRRILVAVDGTEGSTRSMAVAMELAERYQAELVVLTAVSVPQHVAKAMGLEAGSLEEYVERMGRQALATSLALLQKAGRGAEVKIVPGSAAEVIVAEANAPGIDLVVMGRRGRVEPKDLVLGSVSDRVARNIAIPILLIP